MYKREYSMSFGLSYSSVIDWAADFTPRRNHKHAKDYDNSIWCGSGFNPWDAIYMAMRSCEYALKEDGDETQKR
jgi:hypothetical protein